LPSSFLLLQVQDSFSLGRAYTLFRTLGLRHLLVTDRHNTVVGVIARQDLTEGPLLR
jgi:chloride channel 7